MSLMSQSSLPQIQKKEQKTITLLKWVNQVHIFNEQVKVLIGFNENQYGTLNIALDLNQEIHNQFLLIHKLIGWSKEKLV